MRDTSFKHIIPLGYFCSVAMELERKGLRNASYPFDWIISDDFEIILNLLRNGFEGFLDENSLYQEATPNVYYNYHTKIHFYHDFNAYTPLSDQIHSVSVKYNRRIKRLYYDIKEPSLFIRYCKHKEEVLWIQNNLESILSQLKSYNQDNSIVFIVPQTIKCGTTKSLNNGGNFVRITSDSRDIERHYFCTNPELLRYLYKYTSLSVINILNNLRIHYISRIKKKLHRSTRQYKDCYHHDKKYSEICDRTNPKE